MATRPIVCRTPTPDYPPRGAAVLSVAGYEYGPYGEVVREDGWYAAHNRIGYRGQYRERVAGVAIDELVYHGYRYYSPRQGRFINRDPIGEAGGSNGYGYVWNDPVNRIDWLGLRGVWHGAGFEGGGSGQEDEPESADAAAISRVVERGRVLVRRVFGRWDVFPAIERVLAQGEVTAKQSGAAAQGVQGRIDGRPVKRTPGKHAAITFEIPGEFVTDVNALLDQHGFDPLYRRNGRHYLTISALNVEGELVAIPNYRPDRIGARGNQLSGVFHVPGVNELELASTLIQYSANMNTHNLSYPFAGVTGYNSNSFVYSAITHAGGTISQQPGGRRFFSNPYFHSARFPKHRSLMPSSYFDPNE
jgi:RHS repeat-associated protein